MSSLDYDNVFSNSLQEGPVYGKIPYEFVRLRQCFFKQSPGGARLREDSL